MIGVNNLNTPTITLVDHEDVEVGAVDERHARVHHEPEQGGGENRVPGPGLPLAKGVGDDEGLKEIGAGDGGAQGCHHEPAECLGACVGLPGKVPGIHRIAPERERREGRGERRDSTAAAGALT
mgnify:CR=1 FL=1